jgi:ABC-type glycerol-3-phosphate transport system substrate-binding protein
MVAYNNFCINKLCVAVKAGLCCVPMLLAGCTGQIQGVQEMPDKTIMTVLFGQSNSDPGLEDMLSGKIREGFPDVKLEWESVDWGSFFSSEMRARIAAGELPDLIIGKAQDVHAYQPSGFLSTFDDTLKNMVQPFAFESVTANGVVYGIPYNACYQGVIYNKNLFYRYGIETPETLEEMDAVIKKFNDVGITPFASHFRDYWYTGNITMQFAMNQVFPDDPEWGGEFRAGRRSFTGPTSYADCIRQVEMIYLNTWEDAAMVDQYENVQRFANEEAAMYLTGTWTLQAINALRPDMSIGIFPFPNTGGTAKLLFEPNLTFMVNEKSANARLSKQILGMLLSDRQLALDTCDYTQSESLLLGVEADSLKQLRGDIDSYISSGRVADVTAGNKEMLWQFQYLLSEKIMDWLAGKASFDEVLAFADENRAQSGSMDGGG